MIIIIIKKTIRGLAAPWVYYLWKSAQVENQPAIAFLSRFHPYFGGHLSKALLIILVRIAQNSFIQYVIKNDASRY